jgi:hypothetical protein
MMEAVRISKPSVYSNETTGRYIRKALIFILAAVRTWNLAETDLFSLRGGGGRGGGAA